MPCFHIHLRGQVQGVGFRPFVYNLARSQGLEGWVINALDGVHIEFECTELQARRFYDDLLGNLPERAVVQSHNFRIMPKMEAVHSQMEGAFVIGESGDTGRAHLPLTPDFAVCRDCLHELRQNTDRRHEYAFITCTNCGPRYSVIDNLPYDRERTAMEEFTMCRTCGKEYDDPLDRRYYSQTNSCPDCGPRLWLTDSLNHLISDFSGKEVAKTVDLLRQGKIVAVKGIGGFLLMADACNASVVRLLRKRKHRPSKPFALLYPNLVMLSGDAEVSAAEAEAFEGVVSPILLLGLKPEPASGICCEQIAPDLDQIGVMAPYAPLLEHISSAFGKPLIATSANLSGSPIVCDNQEALDRLHSIADYFLFNDRRICTPQDDSILRFAPLSGQRIVMRRSRGMAPSLYSDALQDDAFQSASSTGGTDHLLAMGAMLKSTFAIRHQGLTYVSQYLGELSDYDGQRQYERTLTHLKKMLGFSPACILVDLHRNYPSTILGRKLAKKTGALLYEVQHHEAHFAAVLAENDLADFGKERLESGEKNARYRTFHQKILGVIWDGTGLGHDGVIRGGEYFIWNGQSIKRVAGFSSYPHLMADKMPREPRLSALSVCRKDENALKLLRQHFSNPEWSLYRRMLQTEQMKTTSAGRLFDAAASLAGLQQKSSYEGEAAMRLEQLARREYQKCGSVLSPLLPAGQLEGDLPVEALMTAFASELPKGRGQAALRFHLTLMASVEAVARAQNADAIAFSGGVFQNALLVDLMAEHLSGKYALYFHRELSPNDECVSYGQLAHYYLCHKVEPSEQSS